MTNKKKIRKAVFPVGGFGTRFLPATKSMPKEMLPVVDKPIIQYAFEEARDAGIEQFIFVTGRNKNAISNHFDHSYELQSHLSKKNKQEELDLASNWLPAAGSIMHVRQQDALGLGHAVWCARHLVGDEPFAVLLADDMILSDTPCLKQMLEAYEQTGGNIMAVNEVEASRTHHYGILEVDPSTQANAALVKVKGLVEKPQPKDAPSNLSIIGRYILQPEIFNTLENLSPGAGGEIQLTDAISGMIPSQAVHGYRFEGTRFDCGSRVGYITANVAYALARNEISSRVRGAIAELLK